MEFPNPIKSAIFCFKGNAFDIVPPENPRLRFFDIILAPVSLLSATIFTCYKKKVGHGNRKVQSFRIYVPVSPSIYSFGVD